MPGVVGGDALLEPGEPAVVVEHVEVGVGERLDVLLGDARGCERARRRW